MTRKNGERDAGQHETCRKHCRRSGQQVRCTPNTDKPGAAATATDSKAAALAPLQKDDDHQSNGDEQMNDKQDSAQVIRFRTEEPPRPNGRVFNRSYKIWLGATSANRKKTFCIEAGPADQGASHTVRP